MTNAFDEKFTGKIRTLSDIYYIILELFVEIVNSWGPEMPSDVFLYVAIAKIFSVLIFPSKN